MVAESLIRCVCVCIEVFSSFSFLLFKDLHKNVYVTDRRVELLGCMYDDGGVVVVVVVHSVWTRNASGENVTLSFSLSFSPFSITVVLLFSLFSVINFYRFLFFFSSVLFLISFHTADSRLSEEGTNHYTYISRPGRAFVLYSFGLCKQKQLLEVFNDWLQFDSFIWWRERRKEER
jgi:hypothetical protein